MILEGIIGGESAILQSIRDEHITEEYVQWLNCKEINRYMETRHHQWTQREILDYVRTQNDSSDQLLLGIFLKSGQHIGNIKLGPIDYIHKLASVSLFIGNKSCYKKGYATEVVMLLMDYAFNELGIKKLSAGMYSDNIGSLKTFLRAGFHLEGILKDHHVLSDGIRTDVLQVGYVA